MSYRTGGKRCGPYSGSIRGEGLFNIMVTARIKAHLQMAGRRYLHGLCERCSVYAKDGSGNQTKGADAKIAYATVYFFSRGQHTCMIPCGCNIAHCLSSNFQDPITQRAIDIS